MTTPTAHSHESPAIAPPVPGHAEPGDREALAAAQLGATGRLSLACAYELHRLIGAAAGSVAQLAQSGDASGDVLAALRETLGRAGALTRQLMAVGQRPHGTLTLIDLGELVDGLRPLLTLLAGPNAFVVAVRNDGDIRVLADRTSIEQIMINLIASSGAQRRITVSSGLNLWPGGPTATGEHLPAGRYACLSVVDERPVPRATATRPCPQCRRIDTGQALAAALARHLGGGLVLDAVASAVLEQHVLLPAVA